MKIRSILIAGIGLSVLTITNSASAYWPWYAGGAYGFNPIYGYGAMGYAAGGGAQTAYSANATGMGNLIRAQGFYNEQTSKAAANYEQARAQYIENEQKAFSAIKATQRVNQAEDARRREAERQDQIRGAQFAETHKPMPLTSSQLDSSSGRVKWPSVLSTPDFAEQRKTIEGLLMSQVSDPHSLKISSNIKKVASDMKDTLRSEIQTIPLAEYTEGRRFLDSLAASVH